MGLSLRLQGMPLRWSAQPRATDLSAEGVVPDMDALREYIETAPGGAQLARDLARLHQLRQHRVL